MSAEQDHTGVWRSHVFHGLCCSQLTSGCCTHCWASFCFLLFTTLNKFPAALSKLYETSDSFIQKRKPVWIFFIVFNKLFFFSCEDLTLLCIYYSWSCGALPFLDLLDCSFSTAFQEPQCLLAFGNCVMICRDPQGWILGLFYLFSLCMRPLHLYMWAATSRPTTATVCRWCSDKCATASNWSVSECKTTFFIWTCTDYNVILVPLITLSSSL